MSNQAHHFHRSVTPHWEWPKDGYQVVFHAWVYLMRPIPFSLKADNEGAAVLLAHLQCLKGTGECEMCLRRRCEKAMEATQHLMTMEEVMA